MVTVGLGGKGLGLGPFLPFKPLKGMGNAQTLPWSPATLGASIEECLKRRMEPCPESSLLSSGSKAASPSGAAGRRTRTERGPGGWRRSAATREGWG